MTFIKYKHADHVAKKSSVDPRSVVMVLANRQWKKISAKLNQKFVNVRAPQMGKMCKHKWNGLNFNYQKLSNFLKGTCSNTCFWNHNTRKHDR